MVAGFLVCVADYWGRRATMFAGLTGIVVGVIVMSTAQTGKAHKHKILKWGGRLTS
jgi:hypothetical protein